MESFPVARAKLCSVPIRPFGGAEQVAWQWAVADTVVASFPARLWVEPLRDAAPAYAAMHAVLYGPLVLAGLWSGSRQLPGAQRTPHVRRRNTPASERGYETRVLV
jgi:hypothetical protein